MKKTLLTSFAIFTGKQLCWRFFLIKLQAFRPAILLKRDSNTGVFLCILRIFIFFEKHLRTAAWCKSGTRTPGPGTRDPEPSSKFKSGTQEPLKFKSGTLIIISLHCLTYFVLNKYIHNIEISFHK